MKLPKYLSTVTPFSKILAALLFITFPFAGFLAGMEYQKMVSPQPIVLHTTPSPTPSTFPSSVAPTNSSSASPTCRYRPPCLDTEPKCRIAETPDMCPRQNYKDIRDETVCTQDAKECPDGSYVGRQGPNCEFALCPNVR